MFEVKLIGTVQEDGMLHLAVPEIPPGRLVQVTLREEIPAKPKRTAGGLEGMLVIAPDFDAPLPEMEPYF